MAHTPLKMTIEEARLEVDKAWRTSYSAKSNEKALASISDQRIDYRIMHLIARLFFRGIYFPQLTRQAWARLIIQNRRPLLKLAWEAFGLYRLARRNEGRAESLTQPIES
jgi:hypothetical protein